MAYKIAVATSDGNKIDGHFGSTESFYIYEIEESGKPLLVERRNPFETYENIIPLEQTIFTKNPNASYGGCNHQAHDLSGMESRFQAVSDCRFILCTRCGGFMEKELQKRGISVFAIDIPLESAFEKIHAYYEKTLHTS